MFWSDFLKSLKARGLAGIKLVISDAHEGLKAAIIRVLGAAWQRCRVHWTRNALAYVPKGQHTWSPPRCARRSSSRTTRPHAQHCCMSPR